MENGAPLEVCLSGLPEDEAGLLRLATGLREVRCPERDRTIVAAQRARLLRLAAREKAMKGRSSLKVENTSARARSRWWIPLTAFSGAIACLLVCALAVAVGAGVTWWRLRDANQAGLLQRGSLDPQSAALADARGIVEVQAGDGAWMVAGADYVVTVGQRIRTGALSGVRVVFSDGSQVRVGPNTEISVDELNAGLPGKPRIVALTQWTGEADHTVVSADGPKSRYEVRTPSAIGEAKGTLFHVSVASNLFTRFSVDEGIVAVTNQNVTVVVIAGQSTTIPAGQAPDEPTFRITGEGKVTQVGTTWTIAGQTFLTHDSTVIVGNPQVGDWVFVEGHLLTDGTRLADRIVLLRRALENRFTITGRVGAIGDTAWTVAGQTIVVNEETSVDDGIASGDLVRVEGVILQAGTLVAETIHRIEEEPGLPFNFVGVVQSIADRVWTISGIVVKVDAGTEIDEGLASGAIVQVDGWITEDGSWLAHSIRRVEDEEREFEFTGSVESIAPWVVSGIPFETDEWTEIETGIRLGDRVRVEGRILEDGTWMAAEIERLDDDDEARHVEFVGTVVSLDPWVVSGVPFAVGDETVIEGDVSAGDLVRVKATILPDGTWLATEIVLLSDDWDGLGCLTITGVVASINADQIELLNGPIFPLDDDVRTVGEITVNSVVMVLVCVDAEGTLTVMSVVVIYQPGLGVTPTASPAPTPTTTPLPTATTSPLPTPTTILPTLTVPPLTPTAPPLGEEGKVTICHKPHSKNPHTITVSRSALPAHLDHGDTIGPCR